MVRTLMSGAVPVTYGQIYVDSGDAALQSQEASFSGQVNGLCGAGTPGFLYLLTGLHTGEVSFTVELHDEPPTADHGWEEIVEASFASGGWANLACWGDQGSWALDLAAGTCYRVRYCATGMDDGHHADVRSQADPDLERYLLQFWPAPSAPDLVVHQTSRTAAYWHNFARDLPPPPIPGPWSAGAGRAQAAQRASAGQAQTRHQIAVEARRWGGRLPSQRLRDAGGNMAGLARLDRPLIDALSAADPVTLRKLARWAARRACAEAQLSDIDWISAALDAMDQGEPLPPPFDSDDKHNRPAWDRLRSDQRVPRVRVASLTTGHDNMNQQSMALPAFFASVEPDPLRAAGNALWSAACAFGAERYDILLREVRQVFPALASFD